MLAWLIEIVVDRLRLPRRWDGKNLSSEGTLTTSVRVTGGAEPGLGGHWQSYTTSVDAGHLWFGRRHGVFVESVVPERARPSRPHDRWALDHDFVVVPITSRSGSQLEWALRASALDDVLALLDS